MNKTVVAVVVILGISTLCCGGLGLGLMFMAQEPEDIEVMVDTPLNVVQGESFVIGVRVTNTADHEQTLYSLDIADAYLDGIAITGSDPPYSTSDHIPIDNTWSYTYMLDIAPMQTVQVQLAAQALSPGDYNGEMDVCINSEVQFLSYQVRTYVE